MTDETQAANDNAEEQSPFQIHKIYIKDCTFEIPGGIEIFTQEWAPELNVQIGTTAKALAEKDTHEVTLNLKVEVKSNGKVAFNVEVDQAGVFAIQGLEEEQLHHTLGAFCPNLLYPYVRECITDLVMKGGFPQLNLAPINFDALYQQEQAEKVANKDNVTEISSAEE